MDLSTFLRENSGWIIAIILFIFMLWDRRKKRDKEDEDKGKRKGMEAAQMKERDERIKALEEHAENCPVNQQVVDDVSHIKEGMGVIIYALDVLLTKAADEKLNGELKPAREGIKTYIKDRLQGK